MSIQRNHDGGFLDIPMLLREEMQKSLKRAQELSLKPSNGISPPEFGEVLITVMLSVSYLESFINYWAYNCLDRNYAIDLTKKTVSRCLNMGQYALLEDSERTNEIMGLFQDWDNIERKWTLEDKYKKLPALLQNTRLTMKQKDQLDLLCNIRHRIVHCKFYVEKSPYICEQHGQGWNIIEPDDLTKKAKGYFSTNKNGGSFWHRLFIFNCAEWAHDFSISLVKMIRGKEKHCVGDASLKD